ncbi:MAG: TonB-dependent receptor [Crocinitomicaceae bacterium]|nr:TonB-dependent receptor [Crocinitomicaceae bacterium]
MRILSTFFIANCSLFSIAQSDSLENISGKSILSQDSILQGKTFAPLLIEATYANEKTPMTFNNLSKKQIEPMNSGQDLPYVLRYTPSLVVTSDAGNGVGYTGMWIRGSDPSRINVTINGIPLNDPESQQVFWVNTPDFISGTSNVQIQRGVGTSTNGAASFGGSIKLETDNANRNSYLRVTNGYGSFDTYKNNVQFGTGLIENHFVLEGRLSRIHSDGYIDRASSDLTSYYLAASYLDEKTKIVFTNFSGRESTYQSWNGTPAEKLDGTDNDALLSFAERNSFSEKETDNLLNSGRTYNFYTYDNQVDNYGQDHYQLHLRRSLQDNLYLNIAGHYTKGKGYFEEYKENASLNEYGLNNILINQTQLYSDAMDENGSPVNQQYATMFSNGDFDIYQSLVTGIDGDSITDINGNYLLDAQTLITSSDLVRRRGLDNHFYGGVGSLMLNSGKWLLTLGAAYNEYHGNHFGELIWMQYAGSVQPGDHYYDGKSLKRDGNIYLKSIYGATEKMDVYVDMQMRRISYITYGLDNDLRKYNINDRLIFFNPKAGINWHLRKSERCYASVAVGNKEPNRNDYVDAQGTKPLPEKMVDIEAGYQRASKNWFINANIYLMEYKNQLVLTGELNDVGAPLRTNAPQSYRRGVELEGGWLPLRRLNFYGNLTLSRNKILHFDEVIYDYTNGFDIIRITHNNTDISFSPAFTAAAGISFKIWHREKQGKDSSSDTNKEIGFSLPGKYVGKQFLDNTSNNHLIIPAYGTLDARLTYTYKKGESREVIAHCWVNNVLDKQYASNGYTYSYIYTDRITERFYYPQAGRNFMLGLTLGF